MDRDDQPSNVVPLRLVKAPEPVVEPDWSQADAIVPTNANVQVVQVGMAAGVALSFTYGSEPCRVHTLLSPDDADTIAVLMIREVQRVRDIIKANTGQ